MELAALFAPVVAVIFRHYESLLKSSGAWNKCKASLTAGLGLFNGTMLPSGWLLSLIFRLSKVDALSLKSRQILMWKMSIWI